MSLNMPQFKRHFSLSEARELLPTIRTQFAAVQALIVRIREEQQQNHHVRLKVLRGNGKGPVLEGVSPLIAEVQTVIDEVVKLGVQIKNLESGLIDFPHFLGGDKCREVFLCYEMSEADIGYWHEIEDGYAGRRAL